MLQSRAINLPSNGLGHLSESVGHQDPCGLWRRLLAQSQSVRVARQSLAVHWGLGEDEERT